MTSRSSPAWPDDPAPSPGVVRLWDDLEEGVRAGLVTSGDLAYSAARLERLGIKVRMPSPPQAPARGAGWLEARPYALRRGGETYRVYHVVQEGGKRKQKYLGTLGRANAPEWLSQTLQERLRRANDAMDARFLHDD